MANSSSDSVHRSDTPATAVGDVRGASLMASVGSLLTATSGLLAVTVGWFVDSSVAVLVGMTVGAVGSVLVTVLARMVARLASSLTTTGVCLLPRPAGHGTDCGAGNRCRSV